MSYRQAHFILLLFAGSTLVEAQEEKVNIDLVISIDESVVAGSIEDFRMIAVMKNGSKETIRANYHPGNLSLLRTDNDRLKSDDVETTFLAFNFRESCQDKERIYNYEIDIRKGWLSNYFYVINIYNTDKAKYKKVYDPLEGKNYTFETIYPGGSALLIKKVDKKRPRGKKCD